MSSSRWSVLDSMDFSIFKPGDAEAIHEAAVEYAAVAVGAKLPKELEEAGFKNEEDVMKVMTGAMDSMLAPDMVANGEVCADIEEQEVLESVSGVTSLFAEAHQNQKVAFEDHLSENTTSNLELSELTEQTCGEKDTPWAAIAQVASRWARRRCREMQAVAAAEFDQICNLETPARTLPPPPPLEVHVPPAVNVPPKKKLELPPETPPKEKLAPVTAPPVKEIVLPKRGAHSVGATSAPAAVEQAVQQPRTVNIPLPSSYTKPLPRPSRFPPPVEDPQDMQMHEQESPAELTERSLPLSRTSYDSMSARSTVWSAYSEPDDTSPASSLPPTPRESSLEPEHHLHAPLPVSTPAPVEKPAPQQTREPRKELKPIRMQKITPILSKPRKIIPLKPPPPRSNHSERLYLVPPPLGAMPERPCPQALQAAAEGLVNLKATSMPGKPPECTAETRAPLLHSYLDSHGDNWEEQKEHGHGSTPMQAASNGRRDSPSPQTLPTVPSSPAIGELRREASWTPGAHRPVLVPQCEFERAYAERGGMSRKQQVYSAPNGTTGSAFGTFDEMSPRWDKQLANCAEGNWQALPAHPDSEAFSRSRIDDLVDFDSFGATDDLRGASPAYGPRAASPMVRRRATVDISEGLGTPMASRRATVDVSEDFKLQASSGFTRSRPRDPRRRSTADDYYGCSNDGGGQWKAPNRRTTIDASSSSTSLPKISQIKALKLRTFVVPEQKVQSDAHLFNPPPRGHL